MDSNHRTRKRTDLQSVAVGHLATCPMLSHLSESNQRPTDYKSVALPAELKWPISILLTKLVPLIDLPEYKLRDALPAELKWPISILLTKLVPLIDLPEYKLRDALPAELKWHLSICLTNLVPHHRSSRMQTSGCSTS